MSMERRIIIGLITSTEYCKAVKELWNPQLIESATAKRMAIWCWEYYDKYSKAPGRNIESIFREKLISEKLPKDLAEEIDQEILPGLSKEYDNTEFNLTYELTKTEKYLTEQHLKIHSEGILALIQDGKNEEAEKLAHDFKSLQIGGHNLDRFIVTVPQIRRKNRPKPITLMRPWLKEGQTTIIYGTYGAGKSLLAISVAYVLGVRNFEIADCDLGPWKVKCPTGTLYIDGELGELEMEERVKQFEWIGGQSLEHKMKILSMPEYQLATEDSFYLSVRANQMKIIEWLQNNPSYKLIILDSASTLFGLIEENDNSEWNNKINPFLRDLRALGVSCLLLHHAGKDSKKGLRGASSMGAMAHNIFRLTNHPSKDPDDGEAWFTIGKDKQRTGGHGFKTFSIHYEQNTEQTETHWEITAND
jgi:hypothetical protein